MQRILLPGALALLLSACASGPVSDYAGCEAHVLKWTFGPEDDMPYMDACYTQLNIGELRKYYTFLPIPGSNPDTRQVIDANSDGISDGIRRDARITDDKIYWGAACRQSALRIKQKGCTKLGDSNRTAGCDWIAIHIRAKPGVMDKKVSLTPIWHVRLPDGKEQSMYAKTMTTAAENCR